MKLFETIKKLPIIRSIPEAWGYFKNGTNKGLPWGNQNNDNSKKNSFEDNIEEAEENKRALSAKRNRGEKRYHILTKEEKERMEKYRMKRYQIESNKLQHSKRYRKLLEQGRENSSKSEIKTGQNKKTTTTKSGEKEDIMKRLKGKDYVINGVRYKSLETSLDNKKIIINEETVSGKTPEKNSNDIVNYNSEKYERMKEAYNKTKRSKKIIDLKRKSENIEVSKDKKDKKDYSERKVITKKQERENMQKSLKYETDQDYRVLVDFETALNKKNREKRADGKDDREIG